jgi:hypothetical protein
MHLLSNPSPSSSSESRGRLHSTKVGKGQGLEPDNLKIPVHDSSSSSAKSVVGIACSPPFCDRWVRERGSQSQKSSPLTSSLSVSLLTRLLARSVLLSTLLPSRSLPAWVFTARTCPQCYQVHHIRLLLAQTRSAFELRLRNGSHIPSEFEFLRASDLSSVSKIPCARDSGCGKKAPRLLPDGGSKGAARKRWRTRIGEESGGHAAGHANAVGVVCTSTYSSFYLRALGIAEQKE